MLEKSTGPIDQLCYEHDMEYMEMDPMPYFTVNEADAKFIREMDKHDGILPRFYANTFRLKNMIAPALAPFFSSSKKLSMPAVAKRSSSYLPASSRPSKRRKTMARKKNKKRGTTRRIKRRSTKKKTKRAKVYRTKRRKQKNRGYDSAKVMEYGGHVSDQNAVFVGHGTAKDQVPQAVCRAIIKHLFFKASEAFVDWNDTVVNTTGSKEIFYLWRVSHETVAGATTSTIVIANNATYDAIATQLYNSFLTAFTSTNTHDILSIFLIDRGITGTGYETLAKIIFADTKVSWKVTSELAIQNQSVANGSDDQDETSNAITNNPLKGILYKTKKACGFEPRSRLPANEPNYDGYVADYDSGVILAKNAESNVLQTIKVPPPKFFGASGRNVFLGPGSIVVDKFSYTRTMDFFKFVHMYNNQLTVAGTTGLEDGQAHMFGLEKLLDTRETETNMKIGFQITQSYSASITMKKRPKLNPLYSVNGTAITT